MGIPKSTKGLVVFGMLLAFLIALPLFVWSVVNLNLNPQEKAQDTKIITLSLCGDPCSETAICVNSIVPNQNTPKLVCENGTCRNEYCKDQPNCICPAPPTVTVNCNQDCNLQLSRVCSSGLSCYNGSYLNAFSGSCRNPSCADKTNCNCATATPTVTATPTATATATGTKTATPTSKAGSPNYCGGTCGSNFNCQANFYCYKGYCRNPVCPLDNDCDCLSYSKVTATAIAKKTTAPKNTKTMTPTATLISRLQSPSTRPLATATSTIVDTQEKEIENKFLVKYALPIIGILTLICVSTVYYALRKSKNNDSDIPHISPPTNI